VFTPTTLKVLLVKKKKIGSYKELYFSTSHENWQDTRDLSFNVTNYTVKMGIEAI